MALTKVGKEGVTGISNSSNATAITIDSSENVALTGNATFVDNAEIQMGAGTDLKVFSDGSNGVLRANNGRVYIQTDTGVNLTKTGNAETMLIATPDGSVDLYHNNTKKIETTSTGVTISGNNPGGKIRLEMGQTGVANTDVTGEIQFYHNDASGAGVNADIKGICTNSAGAGALTFGTGTTSATERMRIDSSGNVEIASGGFKAIGVYNNTTGTGANLVVDSAGGFARSTSSQRYKNTIADATHGLTELLALRPVTYKHNGNGDTVFGGLIAEEVHTAGLSEFVDYSQDADGNDQPEALHYANMVSLCIKAIQEQQATITALTARITALEDA